MKKTLPKTHLALKGCGVALIVASGCAFAGPNDTSIVVKSNPATVSVNRPGLATPFQVEYVVTVGNNSTNNTLTYDFKGTTRITDSKNKAVTNTSAEFVGSKGIPCTATPGSTTEVTCAKLSVDKNSTKTFSLIYKTPLSVPALDAGGTLRLTVASTSQAIKGSGFADTILVTQPVTDINLGFETFVTEQGGLFFTGAVGNGCGTIPGSWPTATDPFTTSLFVPTINFTTTAKVMESQDVQSCSPIYTADGCFQSSLTIPSAPGAFASLKIYLRIGPSKIVPDASIGNAVVKYAKDPALPLNTIDVQSCSVTGGPTSGNPCIRSRRAYGVDTPTPSSGAACNGVWEFLVEAVDNGLYRTR